MPIPSLASSLKPRSHISRSKVTSATSESSNAGPENIGTRDDRSTFIPSTRTSYAAASPRTSVDGLKRRSFLPQPGESKQVPRKHGGEEGELHHSELQRGSGDYKESQAIPGSAMEKKPGGLSQARPRPLSMYQTRAATTEQPKQGDAPNDIRTVQSSDGVFKKPALPQPTGLGRSLSLRKPGAPTRSDPPAKTSHSRTLSSSSVAGVRRGGADPRTQTERPRSLLGPSKTVSTTSELGSNGAKSARATALMRSGSVKSQPANLSDPSNGDSLPLSHNARPRALTKDAARNKTRPAFSTLQQHFTPRKTGKAATSTFLHPSVPEANGATLPPEIAGLQTELLQLHLLHEAAARTSEHWGRSATRKLKTKFDEVATMYHIMRDNERQGQEQKNIRALREWSNDRSTLGLVEYIQVISAPLHELPALVDPGGRFECHAANFEHWLTWVEGIWEARKSCTNGPAGSLRSAEGLGDGWKAENAALMRKLTALSSDLERLTQPAVGSTLARIVSSCRNLLHDLLHELEAMQSIENGVVKIERMWVEDSLQSIAQDIGAHMIRSDDDREAWQM